MITCDVCNGKGFVLPDGKPVNAFEGSDSTDVRTCRRCGGEGKLVGDLAVEMTTYTVRFVSFRGMSPNENLYPDFATVKGYSLPSLASIISREGLYVSSDFRIASVSPMEATNKWIAPGAILSIEERKTTR